MKKALFFPVLVICVLSGCWSTLQLRLSDPEDQTAKTASGKATNGKQSASNQQTADNVIMLYTRSGFGVESPSEVSYAAYMLALAEALRKDPRNAILFQGWYGYGGYGYTDPCYYYPPCCCPEEVRAQGTKENKEVNK